MYNKHLIYDLGMHIGQDTDFYLKKGFKVIAVEANPLLVQSALQKYPVSFRQRLAKLLSPVLGRWSHKNFSGYVVSGQLTILNVGIGPHTGTFPFYVNRKLSEWSSFDEEIGAREGGADIIQVEMTTIENVLREFGVPYYMKIDIEGQDMTVIAGLSCLNGDLPKYLSAENGPIPMLRKMVELGYTKFKFINQATVPEMKCPFPQLEGVYIDYSFQHGSSGLFGEETPGDWKSPEEIEVDIRAYWENPERDANIHGWYDLHATY
jgi:FkbM family methyltransferase